MLRGYPKNLCILFSDTKGIQWADTDATIPWIFTDGFGSAQGQQLSFDQKILIDVWKNIHS